MELLVQKLNVEECLNTKTLGTVGFKEISEDDSKKFQSEIQDLTDVYVKKVDKIIDEKEKELLTV